MLKRQFVYFIVAIFRNTLKSFLSQFLQKKQPEILHSRFYQRLTLITKKSDICRCDFKSTVMKNI